MYYFGPCGKKLRTYPDVKKVCNFINALRHSINSDLVDSRLSQFASSIIFGVMPVDFICHWDSIHRQEVEVLLKIVLKAMLITFFLSNDVTLTHAQGSKCATNKSHMRPDLENATK